MAAFNTTTPIQDQAGEILDNCFTSFCGSSRQVYIKEKSTQKECSRMTKRYRTYYGLTWRRFMGDSGMNHVLDYIKSAA